ncbi:MAG TPA: cell division protein ZapA [Magnetospirillaceae bacterium]|nr:cell division protein ZapA [Magnetospirillaceae bacterium]
MSSTVAITIAGRTYEMACEAGQEAMLTSLSQDIDRRARDLLKAVGPVSDTKLLVMVALTLADDLHEGAPPAPVRTAAPLTPPDLPPLDDEADERIAAGIEKLASRIDSIAERLQKA